MSLDIKLRFRAAAKVCGVARHCEGLRFRFAERIIAKYIELVD